MRRTASARTQRLTRGVVLAFIAALLGLSVPGGSAHAASVSLMVSSSSSRTSAVALSGTTRSGALYIFTTPTSGVTKVSFWLDDTARSGLPKQVETSAPFDFRGTNGSTADPWDSTSVANGVHTITVAAVDSANTTTIVTATFTVSNGTAAGYAPQVSTTSNRSAPFPVAGAVLHGNVYVFVPSVMGVTKVSFYLDDKARAHAPRHVETAAPWDLASSGPTTATALPFATTGIANGAHVLSVDVVAGSTTTRLDATFTVLNGVTTPTPAPTTTTTAPSTTTAPPTTTPPTTTTAPPTTAPPATTEPPAPSSPVTTAAPPASASPAPSTTVPTAAPTSTPAPFVSTYKWTPTAPMPVGTTEAESIVLGGKLYLFGGFDIQVPRLDPTSRAWLYDPTTSAWSSLPTMPAHGITHAGIDSDGTRYIYYAGGFAFDPTLQAQLIGTDLVWRYDTVTGTYAAMPSLPEARAMGGLVYISGTLYYFGGSQNYQGTPDSSSVWSLDVAHNATAWVARAPMPNPRNHPGFAVIGGKIYVVGGQHQYTSYIAQSELDRYDPATNTWTTLAPMPSPRGHLLDSTTVIEGRLVVGAGWTTTNASAELNDYNPATNTWSEMTSLPIARTSSTIRALSGDRLIYTNGSAGGAGSTSLTWIGTPTP